MKHNSKVCISKKNTYIFLAVLVVAAFLLITNNIQNTKTSLQSRASNSPLTQQKILINTERFSPTAIKSGWLVTPVPLSAEEKEALAHLRFNNFEGYGIIDITKFWGKKPVPIPTPLTEKEAVDLAFVRNLTPGKQFSGYGKFYDQVYCGYVYASRQITSLHSQQNTLSLYPSETDGCSADSFCLIHNKETQREVNGETLRVIRGTSLCEKIATFKGDPYTIQLMKNRKVAETGSSNEYSEVLKTNGIYKLQTDYNYIIRGLLNNTESYFLLGAKRSVEVTLNKTIITPEGKRRIAQVSNKVYEQTIADVRYRGVFGDSFNSGLNKMFITDTLPLTPGSYTLTVTVKLADVYDMDYKLSQHQTVSLVVE